MKTESVTQTFYRFLDDNVGRHSKIASTAGISQAAISRYYRRLGAPKLPAVEAILAVKRAEDMGSTRRLSNTGRVKRSAASPSFAQQSK